MNEIYGWSAEYTAGLVSSHQQIFLNMQKVLSGMGIAPCRHQLFDSSSDVWCYNNACSVGKTTIYEHIKPLADSVNLPFFVFLDLVRFEEPGSDVFINSRFQPTLTSQQTWWNNNWNNVLPES